MIPAPVVLTEGALTFTFPHGWEVIKYDDSAFHRKLFNTFAGGSKALDFVALGGDELWLIEVKDYRGYERTKPSELPLEVALKVRATLAGLVAVRSPSSPSGDMTTRNFSDRALRSPRRIRVALHLEQPADPRRTIILPATAVLALKRDMRQVDPHVEVGGMAYFNRRGRWTVH